MTRQSLDDHQGVGDNMKDTLRDHAQRMEKYFIQQKGQFQQSFQQYRNELGEHAKNLQESCERNCAISMKLEKRSFQTNSIISSLEESKSQGAEAISDVGLPTSPGRGALPADHASWLSRNGIPDDSPEEGISIPINTSASQDTSDALCGLCSARLETKNSGDDVDIAASENDQDPDSFEKAFANLISESYFNLSDDTDTDSLDFWEANSSEEDSESDSSSPSVSRLGILELPERVRLNLEGTLRLCIIQCNQKFRLFCVEEISKATAENEDGPDEDIELLLQAPCLPLDSCKHLTIEIPLEEFDNSGIFPRHVRLYCREGIEGLKFGELARKCCDHTLYRHSIDHAESIKCILDNRRLAGHLVGQDDTSSITMSVA